MTDTLTNTATAEEEMARAVALRIAGLRRDRGLSFDALAQRAGLAKGTLVQIEQGRANPAISTLCRLAAALGVAVADLVAPVAQDQAVTLVPPDQARRLWQGPAGGEAVLLAGTPGPDMLEMWRWRLMPGERFDAPAHGRATREVLHVTEGTLAVEVGTSRVLIPPRGSALARTDRPHAYANPGPLPVLFLMTVHEPPAGA